MADDYSVPREGVHADKSAHDYGIGSNTFPGLAKLMEEMGELQQVLAKIMALGHTGLHWDGNVLQEKLVEETADVVAALAFFMGKNLTHDEIEQAQARTVAKVETFEIWHDLNQG